MRLASASELAGLGLTAEDFAADIPAEFEVYPENWDAVTTFGILATQWRVGFSGRTGLDYSAIEPTLRMTRIEVSKWPEIFSSLRILEDEALEVMRDNAEMAER